MFVYENYAKEYVKDLGGGVKIQCKRSEAYLSGESL